MTKRTFLAVVLLSLTTTLTLAQQLTGTDWVCNPSDSSSKNTGLMVTFDNNGGCTMSLLFSLNQSSAEVSVNARGHCAIPGTYTRTDNVLNILLNNNKAEVDVNVDAQGANNSTKQMLLGFLKGGIEQMLREQARKMPAEQHLTILSHTDTELVLEDGDNRKTFTAQPHK